MWDAFSFALHFFKQHRGMHAKLTRKDLPPQSPCLSLPIFPPNPSLNITHYKSVQNSISLLHAQDDEMGDLQPSMFVLLLDDAEGVCCIAEDHGMK